MNNNVKGTTEATIFRPAKYHYWIEGRYEQSRNEMGLIEIRKRLWVDGIEVLPESGFNIRSFYDLGFDWGENAGSSSFTAALAICLAIFRDERITENLFNCFREEWVIRFPGGDFEVDIPLHGFLEKYAQRLRPGLYSRFCFSSLLNAREIYMQMDPISSEVLVDLAENYVLHNQTIQHPEGRRHSERRQQLYCRMFHHKDCILRGADFDEVMLRVEVIMARFYWRSMERVLRRNYDDKFG